MSRRRNNAAMLAEIQSDRWIEQNIPGGLNSTLGRFWDNALGGNPNPTFGQIRSATARPSGPDHHGMNQHQRSMNYGGMSSSGRHHHSGRSYHHGR